MPDLANIQADIDCDGLCPDDRDAVAVALTRVFGDSPRQPRGYRDALYAAIVALGDEDYAEARYQLRTARQYQPLVRKVVTDGGTSTGGSGRYGGSSTWR